MRDLLRHAAASLVAPPRLRLEDEVACALASTWSRLPASARAAAAEVARRLPRPVWLEALRKTAGSPHVTGIRSVAEAIHATTEHALAPLLVPMLTHADHHVADTAERALASLALETGLHDTGAGELDRVIAAAAREFPTHRRRTILELAARLLDPPRLRRGRAHPGESALAAWFADPRDESHMALRAVIRKSTHPWMRARAWEWLGDPSDAVAAASLDRIAQPGPDAEYEAVLPRSHLLANPARARRVAVAGAPRVRRAGGLIPSRSALPRLSVAARRGVARLAAVACEDASGRIAALEPLLSDPDAPARLAAVRALPPAATLDYCFDADERIAWFAAARCSTAGLGRAVDSGSPPAWRALARSPHARVRTLAAEENRRLDPWNACDPLSRLAARRAMAANPEGFLAEARARLECPVPALVVETLRLVQMLGIAGALEREIIAASGGNAPERVRATAVSIMAGLRSKESLAALHGALGDSDERVRANAVETLARRSEARQDPAPLAVLVELKSDGSHRVRANAIHGLLRSAAATPAIGDTARMLRDARGPHRAAALWLAERGLTTGPAAQWAEVAAVVAELARHDPVIEVRARAARAAARAVAATRVAWRARAAPLAEEAP